MITKCWKIVSITYILLGLPVFLPLVLNKWGMLIFCKSIYYIVGTVASITFILAFRYFTSDKKIEEIKELKRFIFNLHLNMEQWYCGKYTNQQLLKKKVTVKSDSDITDMYYGFLEINGKNS